MHHKTAAILVLVVLLAFGLIVGTNKISNQNLKAIGDIKTNETAVVVDENSNQAASLLPTEIYFLGDIMLARDVEKRIIQSGLDYPFSNISFPDNSYVVGNFESAIPEVHVPTPNNTFRFSTQKEFLPILKQLGLTHLSLANNHAFDYGLPGYNHTLSSIWEIEITPFGHPSQVASSSVQYLDTTFGTVAILAMHTLFAEPAKPKLSALMDEVRGKSDWQIVYVHWGEEYVPKANNQVKDIATYLADLGVDLIVGHHPHVVQGIFKVEDTLVVPSLGNFIFDQYFSPEVQRGLVAKLGFADGLYLELLPVSSEEVRIQPKFLAGEPKQAFLTQLASSSEESLVGQIINGRLEL